MGKNSSIEWTHHTLNLQAGCSEGCELWNPRTGEGFCYAASLVKKRGAGNHAGFPNDFAQPKLYPYRLRDALKWGGGLCFLDDLGDTFSRKLDDPEYVSGLVDEAEDSGRPGLNLFRAILRAVETGEHWLTPLIPQMVDSDLTFQMLTKQPLRMAKFFEQIGGCPDNFWPMTTITRKAGSYARVGALMSIPAKVRGISYEPILGEVEPGWSIPRNLDWLIVGGASGTDEHPTRYEYLCELRNYCKSRGIAMFVKQLGAHYEFSKTTRASRPLVSENRITWHGVNRCIARMSKKGGDINEWPRSLRIREMPTAWQGESTWKK